MYFDEKHLSAKKFLPKLYFFQKHFLFVRYITSEGAIEFHKPSTKKLQIETKWRRPCKLSVAYSSINCNNDYCIYLIIYEGNIKCRRNLLKEFEGGEPQK